MTFSKPNPGSDEAISQGCTCPVMDNGHGRGSSYGERVFWITAGCPLHGSEVKHEEAKEGASCAKLMQGCCQ